MHPPGSSRKPRQSDDCLSPNELDDGWVRKTIDRFQSGQASFTGKEIFEVDEHCSKLSASFQTPETTYQAFLRDMAYIYATDNAKKLLPENFHKEQSDPEIVSRQLNLLVKDGALKRLRDTIKRNQKRTYRLPFYHDHDADEGWGTLRRGNRMWPTYTTIPHIGYCSKDEQALPAPISTKRELPTDLSPAEIRSIMINDDTGLQRVHREVFNSTGTYKGCLKPAYIWTALERNPETDDLYVSEEVLDRFCPLWRIILEYKGNLQGFDEGEKPPRNFKSDECASSVNLKSTSKDSTSTEDSPGDLTSLVNQMALEIKNLGKVLQDEFKEMKVATASSEESTVLSIEESRSTSEASDEQRVREDYSEVEGREAANSKASASGKEPNEKHQELETIEKEDPNTESKAGSSTSLPSDGLEENTETGLPLVCQNCESHPTRTETSKAPNPKANAEIAVPAQGKGLKRTHDDVDSSSALPVHLEERPSNKRRNASTSDELQNLENSNKEQQTAS